MLLTLTGNQRSVNDSTWVLGEVFPLLRPPLPSSPLPILEATCRNCKFDSLFIYCNLPSLRTCQTENVCTHYQCIMLPNMGGGIWWQLCIPPMTADSGRQWWDSQILTTFLIIPLIKYFKKFSQYITNSQSENAFLKQCTLTTPIFQEGIPPGIPFLSAIEHWLEIYVPWMAVLAFPKKKNWSSPSPLSPPNFGGIL